MVAITVWGSSLSRRRTAASAARATSTQLLAASPEYEDECGVAGEDSSGHRYITSR